MEEQALDFALKTFACGLFPDRSGRDSIEQKDGDSGWQCVANPTEIPGAPGFTSLAAGEDGCLGITPEGDVHRWVATGNSGTITRGFAMEWTLSVLKDEANQRLQLRDIALGYRSQSPSRSRGRLVAVALMDSGDVFASQAWYDDGGDGREGHLPMSCPEWQPLPSLQSTLVAAVACGGGFAMALTAGGELFAWGSSPEGAMGTGSLGDVIRPTLVRGPLAKCRVAVIACGECHSVAATFDEEDRLGAVYSWGLVAADGRLGYVDDEVHPQSSPREVSWISAQLVAALTLRRGALAVPRGSSRRLPQRITQVSCGWRHSVLVCQGSVVCFGANDFGQLGRCAKEPQEVRSKIPPFAHCPLLEDSDHRTIEEARRLCCGPLHTACVCSTGHVHVWGLDLQQGMKARAPWCVPDFGPVRPVVALCCGAHFLVCSAEVVLPRSTEAQIDVPQEDLLLGYCAESLAPGTRSGPATSSNSWRPSHLPPKCEEESKHHQNLVRELERSVQRRLLQEQREEQQRQQREQRRERRLQEHTELWFQLLPNFVPGEGVTARMQRLWRQGLPPKVREVLWPVAIGNVLRITPELFEIHKQRALDARKNQENAASNVLITLTDSPLCRGKEQSTTCIPFDLPRTFPTLAFFDEGGPLHEDCARILEAYTFFRPDIGYVQGMSYLAAMLLLYLPSYQAFVGLCNLLNTPSVLGLYRLEPQAMACRARVFEQLCFQQLPAVARCIENVGLTPEMQKKLSLNNHKDATRFKTQCSITSTEGTYEDWPGMVEALNVQIREMTEKHGPNHAKTLTVINELASVYREVSMSREALALYQEVYVGCQRSLGDSHPYTLASLSNLGTCLFECNQLDEARPLLEETLNKQSMLRGEKHLETLQTAHSLALLLEEQGLLEQAEPLYVRAYEGQKSQLGSTSPVVMQTAVNLAGLKQARGLLDEAEALDREAMQGCRELLGTCNEQTLQSGNCLARLLHEQGMLQESEELMLEVLEGRMRLLGESDPATLTTLNNLGGLYFTWGRWAEAEPHFFAALEGRRAVLGRQDPATLQSANNLAALFQARGRLDKAEPLYRESLAGRRNVLGDMHPDTLTSCSNLASLLHALNQLEEAEKLMNEALNGRRLLLGNMHKDTLTSINNLAGLMRTRGKHEEAEDLYEEALRGRKDLLGSAHMDTLMTANNYGLCLMNRGLLGQAEEMFQDVLEHCREALGEQHAYTLTVANSLGSLLHEAERLEEAEPVLRKVLTGLREQLGEKHLDTLTGANNLAVLLYSREDYAQATQIFQEVLAGRRLQLGEKHPDTMAAARNLSAAQQAQRHLKELVKPPEEATWGGGLLVGCSVCNSGTLAV